MAKIMIDDDLEQVVINSFESVIYDKVQHIKTLEMEIASIASKIRGLNEEIQKVEKLKEEVLYDRRN